MDMQSPHGLAGEEFLYEHVHLNFEGNYLVARVLAEQVGHALPASAEHPWPTADDCACRLGWNDSTRREAEADILSRLNDPPFRSKPATGNSISVCSSKSNSFNPRHFLIPCARKRPAPKPPPPPRPTTGFSRRISRTSSSRPGTPLARSNHCSMWYVCCRKTRTHGRIWDWSWRWKSVMMKLFQPFNSPPGWA